MSPFSIKHRSPLTKDIERICNLPSYGVVDEKETEAYTRKLVNEKAYNNGFRLHSAQADALLNVDIYKSLFAPIVVGGGKSLVTIVAAEKFYKNKTSKTSLLLVPPTLVDKVFSYDLPYVRDKIDITCKFFKINGKMRPSERMFVAASKRSGCYVLPYSILSCKDAEDLLTAINPGVIIADEVQYLKNPKAARTRRFLKFVRSREQTPVFCCFSGTMTKKSLVDYAHLATMSLGINSFLPLTRPGLMSWSSILDSSDSVHVPRSERSNIVPLVNWHNRTRGGDLNSWRVEDCREAYRQRLITCPGVTATSLDENTIGTSIIIHNNEATLPSKIKKAMRDLETKWVSPSGDQISHALMIYKWQSELTMGFFNDRVWPSVHDLTKRRKISRDDAVALLNAGQAYHEANQSYHKLLRTYLKHHHRKGIDTPKLVGQALYNHYNFDKGDKLHKELYAGWVDRHKKSVNGKAPLERDRVQVRLDDYKIQQALKWAKSLKTGGIVWYYHIAIGLWAYEIFQKEFGKDVIYAPAGTTEIDKPENRDKIVIATFESHGTGKNLQHFQNQWFLEWARQADLAEQVLGRTHRPGQEADELVINLNCSTDWDHNNFAATLIDTVYIEGTLNRCKLLYAAYTEKPRLVPDTILKQKGFDNKILNSSKKLLLKQKFG